MFKAQNFERNLTFDVNHKNYRLRGQKEHFEQVMTFMIERMIINAFEGKIWVISDFNHTKSIFSVRLVF